MRNTYTIGLDFGTRSMRALLVDSESGREVGYRECAYSHGIMESVLPDGTKLPPDWSLQHPDDYLDALLETVPALIREYGIDGESVLGIGVDFTSCTVMPLNENLVPLCCLEEWKKEPHAYVKLWKHHGAAYCAERIEKEALITGEPWLERSGGKISSELAFPKILQVALESPEIFDRAEYFMDAGDYVVCLLTGKIVRSTCIAGFKYFWSKEEGFPDETFLNRLAPCFGTKVLKKLEGELILPGKSAGKLSKEFAEKLGLSVNTAVSAAVIDAHVSVPSTGGMRENEMLMILGTSGCHHFLSKTYCGIDGVFGIAKDAVIEGYYWYESGQSGVGDLFEWLLRTCISKEIEAGAKEADLSVLDYLATLAEKKKAGGSGLLCLDWLNGNRSILNDSDLSGVILGLTLSTKAEDLYRALVEALAFGTRTILENYEKAGLGVHRLYATGTMAKSSFVMQTFADVLGKEIGIVASQNGAALGSAIFAAAASGQYTLEEAAKIMGKTKAQTYQPTPENKSIYDLLYREYSTLHDYFGRGINPVLKTLKALRDQ